ncbi:MAG TPA: hypothetical protein VJ927_10700 [Actinomycetota bacterium]|nr:hypothetical protein [Actinomycetota bacterium]
MIRLKVLFAAGVLGATSLLVGPIAPANAAGCEDGGSCPIWQHPICKEQVPKAIRVAAGCFTNQP